METQCVKMQYKNVELHIHIRKDGSDITKDDVEFWNPFNKEWVIRPKYVMNCCGIIREKEEALQEMVNFLEIQNKLWKI